MKEWDGFEGRLWKEEINVRQFIQDNYTPYDGNEDFLAEPTEATNKLWGALQKLQKQERAKGGVLDMETEVVTGITVVRHPHVLPQYARQTFRLPAWHAPDSRDFSAYTVPVTTGLMFHASHPR